VEGQEDWVPRQEEEQAHHSQVIARVLEQVAAQVAPEVVQLE
jgi:hypothetical protein